MTETCTLCEKDIPLEKKCPYINCVYKKKGMSVPVKVKEPRTLWITTPRKSLFAHKAFEDLFDGTMILKPDSIIRPTDVVLFDGGTDISALLYGEEPHIANETPDIKRDEHERACFKRAQGAGAKCLGVCRGAQLLVALSGGKLVQHVSGHQSGHMIHTDNGEMVYTESSHHQVMWPFEIPHVLLAWASSITAQRPFVVSDEYGKEFPGGELPEIVYCKDTKSLCIQGHPEYIGVDTPFGKICRRLVKEFLLSDE